MKGISLHQPWATLVVLGSKTIETRSWATKLRGVIAIHASATFSDSARDLCRYEPFKTILQASGFKSHHDLPLGKILGTAELVSCVRLEEAPPFPELEAAYGDFRPGNWVWTWENANTLPRPIPFKGKLGLFDIDESLLEVPSLA